MSFPPLPSLPQSCVRLSPCGIRRFLFRFTRWPFPSPYPHETPLPPFSVSSLSYITNVSPPMSFTFFFPHSLFCFPPRRWRTVPLPFFWFRSRALPRFHRMCCQVLIPQAESFFAVPLRSSFVPPPEFFRLAPRDRWGWHTHSSPPPMLFTSCPLHGFFPGIRFCPSIDLYFTFFFYFPPLLVLPLLF